MNGGVVSVSINHLPKTCLLTVSNNCHLQCKMCDLWKKDTACDEVNIDECKQFMDQLNAYAKEPVEFHLIGGETFVKEGIFDLIAHARKQGSRTIVTTSGYSITDEVAKKIADSGLSMLNFSIESLNPEVHDYMRGVSGIHQKAMDGIKRVAAAAPQTEIGINTIIVKKNIYDLVDLVRWVDDNERLQQIYFMAVMRPFGSDLNMYWQDTDRAKQLWPRDYKEVERVLNNLSEMKKTGSKIGNSVGQFETFKIYFHNPKNFERVHLHNNNLPATHNKANELFRCKRRTQC